MNSWGIIIDNRYSAIILVLIPIFVYGYVNIKANSLFWYVILTLAFCEGVFDIIGFDASYNRMIRDILLVSLSFVQFIVYRINFKAPFLILISVFVGICFFSMYINGTSTIQLLLFFRRSILFFFLFWLAYNANFNFLENRNFTNYLVLLFVVQIVFAIYKLFIIGINENYIGSISVRGGSLTTIYTLYGTSISFILFLYKKKYLFIGLVFAFVFFGITGSKRATFIFVPVILVTILFLYNVINVDNLSFIKTLFGISLLSAALIYIIVSTNSTLNPENRIGGSFNYKYVVDYVNSYNKDDRMGIGRLSAPELVYENLKQGGIKNILFGFGPGDIISSSLTYQAGIGGDEALLFEKYNIWYGGRTGFLWMIMQIGIIGTVIYLTFFVRVFYKIYNSLKLLQDPFINLSVISFIIIFALDFITYSSTFTLPNIFTYLFYISMAFSLKTIQSIYHSNS